MRFSSFENTADLTASQWPSKKRINSPVSEFQSFAVWSCDAVSIIGEGANLTSFNCSCVGRSTRCNRTMSSGVKDSAVFTNSPGMWAQYRNAEKQALSVKLIIKMAYIVKE